ncbi:MAG: class I SAM-dependent methyltransferase [Natronospirillum sp.]
MTHTAKFWDKMAERYAKRPVSDEAAYQKKLHVTQEYFNPDMEVLELGCGTGSTAIYHAPKVKHIQAVDISTKMLSIAEQKATAAGCDNITFTPSAIDSFTVAENTFDGSECVAFAGRPSRGHRASSQDAQAGWCFCHQFGLPGRQYEIFQSHRAGG